MAVLHLALEEGFDDDEVVVAVDGKEVVRANSVSTRMQIGLAQATDVPVDPGRHTVAVSARGTTAQIEIDVEDELRLGISLGRSGELEHRVSREPFGYV
jgi:hypothetical protein